jgi:hypothetical protein
MVETMQRRFQTKGEEYIPYPGSEEIGAAGFDQNK